MLGFSPLASAPLADDGGVVSVAYTMEAAQGSFTLTGQAATPTADFNITLNSVSLTLSGQATDFTKALFVSAAISC